METSSFRPGGANDVQNKPSRDDAFRKDEYGGAYKEHGVGLSEAERFGTDQMPVQHDAIPAKGLKGVGG